MWWWFKKKPNHLPEGSGPFVPGCADVMLDYSIKGLFLRLYYPSDAQKNQDNYKKWLPWVPDDSYIEGIARLFINYVFFVRFVFWWYGGNKHIPAMHNARLKTDGKFKCVIFSHGVGASRFICSTVFCELASRGYVVASLEHRDQSPSSTYYYQSKENAQRDIRTYIDFKKISFGKDHYEKRNQQLHLRADECCRVLDLLNGLNEGKIPHNVLDDTPGDKGDFKLDDFVNRLDLNDVTAMGHSFGAATALYFMSVRKDVTQGVLFDPWMFPIKGEDLHNKIDRPLLFINTQTFHVENNVKAMAKFLDRSNRQMFTIKHTTHENQTDSVLVAGYWLNWFMKKLDPTKALLINNSLMLKFLHETVGVPDDIKECEELLEKEAHNITSGLTKPWA